MARMRPTRSTRRATGPGPRATSSDPSTIRNEHARPRSGSLKPVARQLPEIVDHRGSPCPICGVTHDVKIAFGRGEEHAIDNVMVWVVWYWAEYEDGRIDSACAYQTVVVPPAPRGNESMAIEVLRKLQLGFAKRIHLMAVEAPPTWALIEAARKENERIDRIRRATSDERR